jgi:hypothetical protein
MAAISSRLGLINYCLRKLGEPVIEVNVDEDQVEDKVDDALQVYQEFHSDATYRTYYTTIITDQNLEDEYVTIPHDVLYVTKMMKGGMGSSGGGWHNFPYQWWTSNMGTGWGGSSCGGNQMYGGMNMMVQQYMYMSMIDAVLNGSPLIEFVRRANRLHIQGETDAGTLNKGQHVAFECYRALDPETHTAIYNDMFMKDFTTALIKEQWGQNMSKFDGMQLPGGVTISGRQILEDAKSEIEMLRERMRLEQECPPEFFVG